MQDRQAADRRVRLQRFQDGVRKRGRDVDTQLQHVGSVADEGARVPRQPPATRVVRLCRPNCPDQRSGQTPAAVAARLVKRCDAVPGQRGEGASAQNHDAPGRLGARPGGTPGHAPGGYHERQLTAITPGMPTMASQVPAIRCGRSAGAAPVIKSNRSPDRNVTMAPTLVGGRPGPARAQSSRLRRPAQPATRSRRSRRGATPPRLAGNARTTPVVGAAYRWKETVSARPMG